MFHEGKPELVGPSSKSQRGSADRPPGAPHLVDARRTVQHVVLDARQKLTSSSGTRATFDYELLAEYADARLTSVLPTLVLLSILSLAAVLWIDPAIAALWASAVGVANLGVALICRRFRKQSNTKFDPRRWTQTFIIAETITGLSWATLPVLTITGGGQDIQIIIFAMLLVGVAANAVATRTLPSATLVTTFPGTVSVAAMLIWSGGTLNYAMSVVTIGTFFFFLFLTRQLYKSEIGNLELQWEKDALILELEEARTMSDEARRHAEQANIAKSRFLATMSHELRTPLTSIIGNAELMELVQQSPFDRLQSLQTIRKSGRHLLTLINDLIDLSRIEAGKYDLVEEAISLVHIAGECRLMLEVAAKAKNIEVSFEADTTLSKIWGDGRAVRQVLINLLSNAVKFTPKGGKIALTVSRSEDGGQLISVFDNGPGIPEDEIETVLSSFGQGSLAQKTAEQGAGLGLPIVQKIMDLHQGRFDLFSKLSFGTEVIATFPRSRVLGKDSVPNGNDSLSGHAGSQLGSSSIDTTSPWPSGLSQSAPIHHSAMSMDGERLRVLVVEDDLAILHIIRSIVQTAGHEVMTSPDGETALGMLQQTDFDCVLLDMQLPGMKGTEVKEAVDSIEGMRRSAPIFFAVTADVLPDQRAVYRSNGFADVVEKPFESGDIIDALLEAQRLRQEQQKDYDYPSLIDPARMSKLELSLEPQEFAAALEQAKASLSSSRAALARAIAESDLPQARKICHTLAGTAGQYGLTDLHNDAKRVLLYLRSGKGSSFGKEASSLLAPIDSGVTALSLLSERR